MIQRKDKIHYGSLISTVYSDTVAVSLALFVLVYLIGYPAWALGLFLGGIWMATNIRMIQWLVEEFFGKRRRWFLMTTSLVKFPVLYGVGVLLFYLFPDSILAMIAGIHIPFGVMIRNATKERKIEHSLYTEGKL